MKIIKNALFLLLVLIPVLSAYAQAGDSTPDKSLVFRFVADSDTFFIPYQGNGAKLKELTEIIEQYKGVIADGTIKIHVAGYCSSYATAKENLRSAAIRANRVKSELIIRNGVREEHFATSVYGSPYEGRKSVVVVTLHIPAAKEELQPAVKETPAPEPVKEEPRQEPEVQPQPAVEQPEPVATFTVPLADPFSGFSLRTNLLYDAFLLPTLGAEWRINPGWSIKVDGSFSHWGSSHGDVQKIWMVSPEVRWYQGGKKRLYVGLGANAGQYNVYGYPLGKLLSDDTGYQGEFYGGGVTVGYQLPLGGCFSLDFNLGLGYTRFEYDSFDMTDNVRVYKDRDQTKNFWGPTQAGVTLVWKIVK